MTMVREAADIKDFNHIVVGTTGRADHGKSTLVGSLVTGKANDGDGGICVNLDGQPHEVECGTIPLHRNADPTPGREFEEEVVVLNHPLRINAGCESVLHVETFSEAAAFYPEVGQLLPSDTGETTIGSRSART